MTDWLDSNVPSVGEIQRRLQLILSQEVDPRNRARREMAAKTIFVMLYTFAVEGRDRWIRPTAVTDMTDGQAAVRELKEREAWLERVQGPDRPRELTGRWYSENTREPIRDETLRLLVDLGCVIELPGLATTSPRPRYALARSFADLLNPSLEGSDLEEAIAHWQGRHLGTAHLARIQLVKKGAGKSGERVLVTLPTGETRSLAPGPSSLLTQAVIESFAPRFLEEPAVVLVSESAKKATYEDRKLLESARLSLDPALTLPDLILIDLGATPPLLTFVECVISDGPIDTSRRGQLLSLAAASGYDESSCAFVTAFQDRARSRFASLSKSLAWGSFVWFASEPDHIIFLAGKSQPTASKLRHFLDRATGDGV